MRVMLVYPNDRMDSLIPVGLSVLSGHFKKEHQMFYRDKRGK